MEILRETLLAGFSRTLDLEGFSGDRLATRLSSIAQIGLTSNGGSCRLGYSVEEKQVKNLICQWMASAGFVIRTDAAGNCFGRIEGTNNSLPSIMCGSHVDTVPDGGHFDGVLGVLLAVEVVEMWRATGFVPERSYEVAIFSEEEGSRFNVGFVGSSAFVGQLPEDEFSKLYDHEGRSFASVVEQSGLSIARFHEARGDLSRIAAFVEVHIEQGRILERQMVPVGIVNGICGLVGIEMTVKGLASHAGATPMRYRRDALVAASHIVAAISKLPSQFSDTAVATVGQLNVFPNGANVIPGEVRFSIDIRDISAGSLEQLTAKSIDVATKIAVELDVELTWKKTLSLMPTPVNAKLRNWQAKVMREINLAPFELPSGAGHDAMVLGMHVPMAMFFVRSKDGISHNPLEFTTLDDCAAAAMVLSRFLKKILSLTETFDNEA